MGDEKFSFSIQGVQPLVDSSQTLELSLNELNKGLPGLSPIWGQFLCEASTYCFQFHKHLNGVELKITGMSEKVLKVNWESEATEQIKRAWNDEQDLTEFGACGIAILLILKLTNFTVIQRARKGSGIDYWLGYKDSDIPFQNSARLEVSGILTGDEKTIASRANQKLKQTEPSDNLSLPAFVAIVEFSKPQTYLVKK